MPKKSGGKARPGRVGRTAGESRGLKVGYQIPDQNVVSGSFWDYTVPANAFSDSTATLSAFGANLTGGVFSLESFGTGYINFEPVTRLFYANTTGNGDYHIRLVAKKGSAQTVFQIFTLHVEGELAVGTPISNQTATVGVPFSVSFTPSTAFSGPYLPNIFEVGTWVGNTTVEFTALPDWLSFNLDLTTISGTANGTNANTGTYHIVVRGYSWYGQHADNKFDIVLSS